MHKRRSVQAHSSLHWECTRAALVRHRPCTHHLEGSLSHRFQHLGIRHLSLARHLGGAVQDSDKQNHLGAPQDQKKKPSAPSTCARQTYAHNVAARCTKPRSLGKTLTQRREGGEDTGGGGGNSARHHTSSSLVICPWGTSKSKASNTTATTTSSGGGGGAGRRPTHRQCAGHFGIGGLGRF
jgi:hypothetical protein